MGVKRYVKKSASLINTLLLLGTEQTNQCLYLCCYPYRESIRTGSHCLALLMQWQIVPAMALHSSQNCKYT